MKTCVCVCVYCGMTITFDFEETFQRARGRNAGFFRRHFINCFYVALKEKNVSICREDEEKKSRELAPIL